MRIGGVQLVEAGAANWPLLLVLVVGGSSVWCLDPPEPPESRLSLDSSSLVERNDQGFKTRLPNLVFHNLTSSKFSLAHQCFQSWIV